MEERMRTELVELLLRSRTRMAVYAAVYVAACASLVLAAYPFWGDDRIALGFVEGVVAHVAMLIF
jgi:hypothetical protein